MRGRTSDAPNETVPLRVAGMPGAPTPPSPYGSGFEALKVGPLKGCFSEQPDGLADLTQHAIERPPEELVPPRRWPAALAAPRFHAIIVFLIKVIVA